MYCVEHKLCSKLDCSIARPVGAIFCSMHRSKCVKVDCLNNKVVLGTWRGRKRNEWKTSGEIAEACWMYKCQMSDCKTTLEDSINGYCTAN